NIAANPLISLAPTSKPRRAASVRAHIAGSSRGRCSQRREREQRARAGRSGFGEQVLEILAREAATERRFAEDLSRKSRLALLELEDLLLDGARRKEPVGDHRTVLSDPVGTVDRLRLDRGVPPGIEEHDIARR